MRRFIFIAFSFLLTPLVLPHPADPDGMQSHTPAVRSQRDQRTGDDRGGVEDVVRVTEQGIVGNAVAQFESFFAAQIYLHVRDEEEGYFSSNQASLILRRFFATGRILNFHFSTTQVRKSDAFATGGGTMMVQGSPRILQIYIALSRRNSAWVLTQFSIF